jgi:D-serine deaminase-like pyridoxal phosphate-dependent protein
MNETTNPRIDGRTKGLPCEAGGIHLADIGERRWNLLRGDLPLPIAILRETALANNSRWMRQFLAQSGARLAPHGKTTMSPQLFARQLQEGAWGLTLSTVQQVRVARQAGVPRILLANQIVGRHELAYLFEELRADPGFELYVLADSAQGIERLREGALTAAIGRPLPLLLEVGYAGGRAGCRDLEDVVTLGRLIKAAEPLLALHGVEGYEGLHQSLSSAEGVPKVAEFLRFLVAAAQRLDGQKLFAGHEVILSAGGSAYYDLASEMLQTAPLNKPACIVIRSGCYLTHDTGLYARLFEELRERSPVARCTSGGFQTALEVWAYVQSVPEPGRAIINAGRRDVGHDAGLPVPLKYFRRSRDFEPVAAPADHKIVAINDQHAHMIFPSGDDLDVGDMVALGISHPCTTFDKWRLIYVVDDAYTAGSAIQTFF